MGLTPGQRRRVGDTALELPVLGLGTAPLGELYARMSEDEAHSTLDRAWSDGIRYFDTAPWYGRGLAEHRTGSFLRTCPRDEFVITTKVGRTLRRPADMNRFDSSPWVGGLRFEVRFDYTAAGIERSYDEALQRLSLDTVDALVIHDLDAGYHGAELARHRRDLDESGLSALRRLRDEGQVCAIGMGINAVEDLDVAAAGYDLDFLIVALPYTLLDHRSLHRGMKLCHERGISVIIGAPFASGILATGSKPGAKYGYAAAPPEVQQRVRAIEAVCEHHGVALKAAALQFVLAHPAVVSVIPGLAGPREVDDAVEAIGAAIPDGFWAQLHAEGLIDPAAPVPAA